MLCLVPASFADDDHEYYIHGADIDIYVLENGLLHIKETFHPTTTAYTFFSSARGPLSRRDCKLGYKLSLNRFKR